MAPELKKGIKSIAGETKPKVGTTYTYEVTGFYGGSQEVDGDSINWVVYKAERSGGWKRLPGTKKGLRVEFTFNQIASGQKFLIEVYLTNPEQKAPPGLIVEVAQGAPRIVAAKILDENGEAISENAHFGQVLTLEVQTENMLGRDLQLELWEADLGRGSQLDPDDLLWKSGKVRVVHRSGKLSRQIGLSPAFRKKGGTWQEGWEQEIYLLVRAENLSPVESDVLPVRLKLPKVKKIKPGNAVAVVDVEEIGIACQENQQAKDEEEENICSQEKDKPGSGCLCFDQEKLNHACSGKGLLISEEAYKKEADRLGIEVAMIKAIAKQESKKSSFWEPGQATILYERHVMWDQLAADMKLSTEELRQLQKDDPGLVNKKGEGYGTYSMQYKKLEDAKKIDYACAVKSCSWGKFQVMGYHYAIAFESAEEMEQAVNTCELQQFYFFIAYLENTHGLIKAMKEKDWEDIAKKYNGSLWKKYNPDYADNIERYYYEYSK